MAIILSFAYPTFNKVRNDPLHIFAFALSHVVMVVVAFGFIVPRALDIFVPPEKLSMGKSMYAPQVVILGVHSGEEAAEAGANSHETEKDKSRVASGSI